MRQFITKTSSVVTTEMKILSYGLRSILAERGLRILWSLLTKSLPSTVDRSGCYAKSVFDDDYQRWVDDFKMREYLRMSMSSPRNLVAIMPLTDGPVLSEYERWSIELGYAPFFTRCTAGYKELERYRRLTRRRFPATIPS